jgi:transcriptional regulator with XRE-family HTH domain
MSLKLDINQRIAGQVSDLRKSQGLSLDALAARSGVSRSNISLIESGLSSPTAVVLDRLSAALGVTVASLFEGLGTATDRATAASPVARVADQVLWTDPGSGYVRRNVSPPASALQLVDVLFPAGQRVVFETAERPFEVQQQVWMIDGQMQISVGAASYGLHAGDCLAMQLDQPISFHNRSRKPARYLVALTRMASAPIRRTA